MNFYSFPPLLTLICFLVLAIVAALNGRKTKVNTLFTVICLLGSLLYVDILIAFNTTSPDLALRVSRLDHFLLVFLFPVYIHFFHEYLHIKSRKRVVYAAYLYAVILMLISQTPLFIKGVALHPFGFFAQGGPLYAMFGLGGLLVTVYVLVRIYYAIQKEKKSLQKNKLKYVFTGFGIMGLMNGLNILPIYGFSIYPPGNLSFIPLMIFGVGLFRYNVLDMDMLIRKGLIYSILTTLLTGLYALIILVVSSVFKDAHFSGTLTFQLCFLLIIILVFGPMRHHVQQIVDSWFSKGKYDYQQTLKYVSQKIVTVLNIDDVAEYLMDTIVDIMRVNTCALFLFRSDKRDFAPFAVRGIHGSLLGSLSFKETSPIARLLINNRKPVIRSDLIKRQSGLQTAEILSEMDDSHGQIVLPLFFEKRLTGFILLGEKLSGDFFTSDDINLLEILSNQTALALENARSYEKIDTLNKNLEAKVRERTKDLKNALDEKEKTQEQLIRAESLASIGQLVAGTAHELNNPLASAASLLQSAIEDLMLWKGKDQLSDNLLDDLKFADRELRRAGTIVSSLLGLSRQTRHYSEAVNLNTVLKDALRILHNQYKYRDLCIVENYADNLPDIYGNFANLGQVAINIIKNAIQAVEGQSGSIFLTTRYCKKENHVVFECMDTGHGIPESIRKDIFKPFFTTKKVGDGTGLGLYICHEIIQRHEGSIEIEDTDQHGIRFVTRLPVRSAPEGGEFLEPRIN